MSKTTQWALTVSAVSIVSGILTYLLPKSSQKNFFKVLTGIIFIYAVFQPLTGNKDIDFKIDNYLSENYSVSENFDKYALDSVVRSAEKAIEDLLNLKAEEKNINCVFRCECSVKSEEIYVKNLYATYSGDQSMKEHIYKIVSDIGLSESVIVFEGD